MKKILLGILIFSLFIPGLPSNASEAEGISFGMRSITPESNPDLFYLWNGTDYLPYEISVHITYIDVKIRNEWNYTLYRITNGGDGVIVYNGSNVDAVIDSSNFVPKFYNKKWNDYSISDTQLSFELNEDYVIVNRTSVLWGVNQDQLIESFRFGVEHKRMIHKATVYLVDSDGTELHKFSWELTGLNAITSDAVFHNVSEKDYDGINLNWVDVGDNGTLEEIGRNKKAVITWTEQLGDIVLDPEFSITDAGASISVINDYGNKGFNFTIDTSDIKIHSIFNYFEGDYMVGDDNFQDGIHFTTWGQHGGGGQNAISINNNADWIILENSSVIKRILVYATSDTFDSRYNMTVTVYQGVPLIFVDVIWFTTGVGYTREDLTRTSYFNFDWDIDTNGVTDLGDDTYSSYDGGHGSIGFGAETSTFDYNQVNDGGANDERFDYNYGNIAMGHPYNRTWNFIVIIDDADLSNVDDYVTEYDGEIWDDYADVSSLTGASLDGRLNETGAFNFTHSSGNYIDFDLTPVDTENNFTAINVEGWNDANFTVEVNGTKQTLNTDIYGVYNSTSGNLDILFIDPLVGARNILIYIAGSIPEDPNLLFGAGFNGSIDGFVLLEWNHSGVSVYDYELQNSSDGITFAFLDNVTVPSFNHTNIGNLTYTYYRVRARNFTLGRFYNSSWSDINLERVYFIPFTEEGELPFGEGSAALGQFIDNFINETFVMVAEGVVQNSTLNAMILERIPGVEWIFSVVDYNAQFEGFPVGWTTGTAGVGAITKDNEKVYNGSWAVKVSTPDAADQAFAYQAMAEQAGDYHLRFYIFPDGADEPDNCYVVLMHDNGATTNLITILDYQAGVFYLQNQDADSTDNVGALIPDAWNKVDVNWDDTANKFNYSINDVYMGLFDDFTDSNPDRCYIGDTSAGAQSGIYWLDAIAVGDAALSGTTFFNTSGYFVTEDYLNFTPGNSLVVLINSSIPGNTSLTIEFSNDNVTWVDNDGNPGATTILEGHFSVDLRDLDYPDLYQRINLNGTLTDSPEVYQLRLITTNDTIPPSVFNLTGEWIDYNLTEIGVTTGTLDSGNLASTYFIDGDMFNVSEVVGAPGMMISANVTGIDDDAISLWITIYVLYDGNLNHDFDVEVWDFTNSVWVEDSHIEDGVALGWVNSTVYGLRVPDDFLNGGELRIRLDHESAGNINHDLFIDYFRIQAFVPSGPAIGGGNGAIGFIMLGLISIPVMVLLAVRKR